MAVVIDDEATNPDNRMPTIPAPGHHFKKRRLPSYPGPDDEELPEGSPAFAHVLFKQGKSIRKEVFEYHTELNDVKRRLNDYIVNNDAFAHSLRNDLNRLIKRVDDYISPPESNDEF